MNHFIAKDDGKYVLFSITFAVVPYVGTWIEIFKIGCSPILENVVPYVGTWIEMITRFFSAPISFVVPYVGTWIEIFSSSHLSASSSASFPTWERG